MFFVKILSNLEKKVNLHTLVMNIYIRISQYTKISNKTLEVFPLKSVILKIILAVLGNAIRNNNTNRTNNITR